ncbi:MAG TPA: hypothetical protein VMZ50_07320 [Phycisphaerae bacterium]|nr:hypothetical protein [Phycisphaerae bacterium]
MSAIGEKKWVGALAVAAIVVGAVVLIYNAMPGRGGGYSRVVHIVRKPRSVTLFCPKCGLAFKGKVKDPGDFPVRCPRCGERTGVLAWWCTSCRRVFVEDPVHTHKGDFPLVRCPVCGRAAEAVDSLLIEGSLSPSDVPGLGVRPGP